MKFKSEDGKLDGYEDLLKTVFKMRRDAKVRKEEAASMEAEANGLFLDFTKLVGVEAVESDIGTMRIVHKEGAQKLDKDKLKEYLVKKGVDSDLVVEAFKKCTTQGKGVEYVGYFEIGGK